MTDSLAIVAPEAAPSTSPPFATDNDAVFHNYSASDDRKVFCSRVPAKIDDEKLKTFLELQFSVNVEEVKLMEKDDIKAKNGDDGMPEPVESTSSQSSAVPKWMVKKQVGSGERMFTTP